MLFAYQRIYKKNHTTIENILLKVPCVQTIWGIAGMENEICSYSTFSNLKVLNLEILIKYFHIRLPNFMFHIKIFL